MYKIENSKATKTDLAARATKSFKLLSKYCSKPLHVDYTQFGCINTEISIPWIVLFDKMHKQLLVTQSN